MTNPAYVSTVSNNRSFSPRRALGRLVLAILAGLTLQAGRVDAQPNPPLLTLEQRLTIMRIKIRDRGVGGKGEDSAQRSPAGSRSRAADCVIPGSAHRDSAQPGGRVARADSGVEGAYRGCET